MLTFLIGLIITPLLLATVAGLGYFFGVILVYIPLINDLLTEGIGLSHEQLPTILAWLFMAALVFSFGRSTRKDD